jgi:hypothetical protein
MVGNVVNSGPASWTTVIDANGTGYAYRIVTATGTYSPVFAITSSDWNSMFLALKMSSGGTTQQGSVSTAMGRTVTATGKNIARATVVI